MEPLTLMTVPMQSTGSLNANTGSVPVAGAHMASSPCAGCKFLRRKCQTDCVFAPYFPPDEPQKFVNVHRVFGASNVAKILNDLHPLQREDAVNSLAYEAEMRLRDPVYGCVGIISLLQHQLRQLQLDLSKARSELCRYQAVAAAAGMDQQRMAIMRGYGAAGEICGSVGNCDVGLMAAATAAAGMGLGGQIGRFSSAAGGDDRQTMHG